MNVSQILTAIMTAFMFFGAIDKIFLNNRFGYGEQFEEGVNTMGPLALSMVGIMCLAPVIGNVLTPILAPVYHLIGADPAGFAGSILAIDMGGYPLAKVMTSDQNIIVLSGILLGSTLGCTIVFSIPVSLGICEKEDRPYLSKGIMIGIISIPFGVLIGALMAGIPIGVTLVNLIIPIIIAALLAIGLWRHPDRLMRGFGVFSKIIEGIVVMAFACAIVEALTGLVIIPGMDPIGPQLQTIGVIAITLAGAYPFVHFITTALSKGLTKIGRLLGINDIAVGGIIAALANSIPTFGMLKDMDNRGKVMAVAFAVPAVAALGDHLGYVTANAPEYLIPMVVGKIIAGFIAIALAYVFLKKEPRVDETTEVVSGGEN
jgi:ethanolamine transporter